jgi:hypothetical protein
MGIREHLSYGEKENDDGRQQEKHHNQQPVAQ